MNSKHVFVTMMSCLAALTGACDEPGAAERTDEIVTDEAMSDEAAVDEPPSAEPGEQALPEAELAAAQPTQAQEAQEATVVGVEVVNVTIPAGLHAQGLALPAKLVRPKWSKPVADKPAMLVLHGSGGLLKSPKGKSDQPCSDEMENQFKDWSDRLAKLGYTVLLPSSYSARGFCERLGVLGFSQGGTMVMLALHWQIDEALAHFRKTMAKDFDIEVPDVKPGRPEFQMGIAYYPGCAFDGRRLRHHRLPRRRPQLRQWLEQGRRRGRPRGRAQGDPRQARHPAVNASRPLPMPAVHRHIEDGFGRRTRPMAIAGGSDPNRGTNSRIVVAPAATGQMRCMSVSASARCPISGQAAEGPQRTICENSGRYTYLWAGV